MSCETLSSSWRSPTLINAARGWVIAHFHVLESGPSDEHKQAQTGSNNHRILRGSKSTSSNREPSMRMNTSPRSAIRIRKSTQQSTTSYARLPSIHALLVLRVEAVPRCLRVSMYLHLDRRVSGVWQRVRGSYWRHDIAVWRVLDR